MAQKKQEQQVNLVRKVDSKTYRVVPEAEIFVMRLTGRVTVEKALIDESQKGVKIFYTYYVEA